MVERGLNPVEARVKKKKKKISIKLLKSILNEENVTILMATVWLSLRLL